MVRRLLLTALVAVLAVALPVAADEEPAPSEAPQEAPPPESNESASTCLAMDPTCAVAPLPACPLWDFWCLASAIAGDGTSEDRSSCSVVNLHTLTVDDGDCIRKWIVTSIDELPVVGNVDLGLQTTYDRLPALP